MMEPTTRSSGSNRRTCRRPSSLLLMAGLSSSLLILCFWSQIAVSDGFVIQVNNNPITPSILSNCGQRRSSLTDCFLARRKKPNTNVNPNKQGAQEEDGEVGTGPNWIERSFPVDTGMDDGGTNELKKIEDYNLGISGVSFQTGSLSKRMFDAIMTKSSFAANPNEEIRAAFTLYAMDFTAKEAAKAALKQNGLELALSSEEEEDEGMWGDIDSIRLLDENDNPIAGSVYESTQDAITTGGWTPGQGFDFVVRQVPAKLKELSLDELLQALDPDGSLREEAKEANMTLPGDDDDMEEGIYSLQDLANDGVQRTEDSPRGATTEENAFAGIEGKRGYKPIALSDLLQSQQGAEEDGELEENEQTLMHVMNAMVAHGALIVDMTNGGQNLEPAKQLAQMWKGLEQFYNQLDAGDKDASDVLPPMTTVMEAGSQSAKVGYASVQDNSLQFLETRRDRTTGELLPKEAREVLGQETVDALDKVFGSVLAAGKAAVRIAVAASSMEWQVFANDADASKAAALMADELLDDGSSFDKSSEYPICMSPHRLCRYSNTKESTISGQGVDINSREVFGAHVDSSWMTIVPVAAVSGLEVLDETEEIWYRPELAAKRHFVESGGDIEDDELPWYSRYVVLMPGELLQLASRNEIPAAVHRVVATMNCPSRMSAPILLRCRPGVTMDCTKYLGGAGAYALLQECDGMTIEEIHNALQPSSYQ